MSLEGSLVLGGTVVQQLAPWPHRKEVPGVEALGAVQSLNVIPMSARVLPVLPPASFRMHLEDRWTDKFKCLSGCLSMLALQWRGYLPFCSINIGWSSEPYLHKEIPSTGLMPCPRCTYKNSTYCMHKYYQWDAQVQNKRCVFTSVRIKQCHRDAAGSFGSLLSRHEGRTSCR